MVSGHATTIAAGVDRARRADIMAAIGSFAERRAGFFIAARNGTAVTPGKSTIHEVDFCSQVASTANSLILQNPSVFPFHEARVEGYGTGAGRRKRKDLRFYDQRGKLVLCGEVKLPGTPEGRSPYDAKLCEDAEAKANNATLQSFCTWRMNPVAAFAVGPPKKVYANRASRTRFKALFAQKIFRVGGWPANGCGCVCTPPGPARAKWTRAGCGAPGSNAGNGPTASA